MGGFAPAYSQNIPSSVDSGRIERRIAPLPPQKQTEELFIPEGTKPAPAKPSAKGTFILRKVTVEGATAFSQEEIAQIYREYLDLPAGLDTLNYIAGRITELYRSHGYFLSKAVVSEQQITDGVAKIAVVEGYVSRVRMEGTSLEKLKQQDRWNLLEKFPKKIMVLRPVNAPELERQLLLLNDLAGITAHAVIEPLPEEKATPGGVGMVIHIEQSRYSGQVSLDNSGSRFTGPWEVAANATSTSNLIAFDRAYFTALTTPTNNEVHYFSAGYDLPVATDGTALSFHAGYSDSAPGFHLKTNDIKSFTYSWGLGVNRSVIRSRETNVSLGAALDFKNSATDVLNAKLSEDRIRVLRLTSHFDAKDGFRGSDTGAVTVSQGLDILDASETGSRDLSRANGHSDFTKVEANLSRLQQFDNNIGIYASASGQYAWMTLLSSEEFGYGGQAFGRAYDPSEMLGDQGIAAAVEMRYDETLQEYHTRLEPFIFYDVGEVWNVQAAIDKSTSGASAGMGVRFWHGGDISGSLTAALPLTRPEANPIYGNGKNPRWLFQLSYATVS